MRSSCGRVSDNQKQTNKQKKALICVFVSSNSGLLLCRKRPRPSHRMFFLAAASLEAEEAPPSCLLGADRGREVSSGFPGSHPVWSELSVWAQPWVTPNNSKGRR